MKPEKNTNTTLRIVIIVLAIPIIWILATSFFLGGQSGRSIYDVKKQECGHDPVIFKTGTDFGGNNGQLAEITMDSTSIGAKDKFYCTLTEGINDGWHREIVNDKTPAEIKRLYP